MFEVIVFVVTLTLVHFLVPIVRITHIFPLSIIMALGSGVAISHWVLYTPAFIHNYAVTLAVRFFQSEEISFFVFWLFFTSLMGFVTLLWFDSIVYHRHKNHQSLPGWLYYSKLLTIFSFNFSSSHYIPIAAYKQDREIYIYFIDAIVYYILSDLSISKAYPGRYRLTNRIFSISGVFAGVLCGFLGMNHSNDWFMAWFDAFFHGCALFLITKTEFTTWDTEKYFLFFLIGVIVTSIIVYLYQ